MPIVIPLFLVLMISALVASVAAVAIEWLDFEADVPWLK